MITFLLFLAVLWAVSSSRNLSQRIDNLERKLNAQMSQAVKPPMSNSSVAMPAYTPPAMSATPQPTPVNNVPPLAPDNSSKFAEWLAEDWLMKLGAFLFIVGFGWFVSYAFANNWIGPVGRISMGIVGGMLVMTFGYYRMMKYPSQGAVFLALGAGMTMLTVFAGRTIYHFFTPSSAIFFDFIIAMLVSLASYKFNLKSLAYLAQVFAFIAPLFTGGETTSVFLFSYLFVVSLATLLLAGVTGWRDLIESSLVFVGMYSLPYVVHSYGFDGKYVQDAPLILNFAYVFTLLYLFAGMVAVMRKGVEDFKSEITLAVLNGFFLFAWIQGVAPKEWQVMLFSGWAIVFAVVSFVVYKSSSKLDPFYAYGSVAIAFIAAATSAQLDGASLIIAFTVEIFLLVVMVWAITQNIKAASSASWFFLVPAVMSMENMTSYTASHELFSKDFFVIFCLMFALIVAGRIITHNSEHKNTEENVNSGGVLVVFGVLYLGFLVWNFIHILMAGSADLATMTTLVIFTIFGLIAYFDGLYTNDVARKTYGVALLAFVVLRLIFVDVWQMELFGRVITFGAIGVLLMSTAFLTKNKKHEEPTIVIK